VKRTIRWQIIVAAPGEWRLGGRNRAMGHIVAELVRMTTAKKPEGAALTGAHPS
jgi:hypothetical protein